MVFSQNLAQNECMQAISNARLNKYSEHALVRRRRQQAILMQSNMNHSARHDEKHPRCDLHY